MNTLNWHGLSMPPVDFFKLASINEAGQPILYMLRTKRWMDVNGNSHARLVFGIDGSQFNGNRTLFRAAGQWLWLVTCNEFVASVYPGFRKLKKCDWVTAWFGIGAYGLEKDVILNLKAKFNIDVVIAYHDLTP